MARVMTEATDADAGQAPVAGLLLAAGGGRRLGGRPKALLRYRGRPLVERAVRVLGDGGCGPVHVVLGAGAAQVRAALAAVPEAVPVDNPGWSGGMGSSLRAGLASLAAMEPEVSAVLVMLVDQPRIGAAAVARVLAAHRAGAGLVSAAYSGERGHPVLFAREHWEGVAQAAEGDRGARGYLRRHADAVALVECSDIAAPDDIDTPEDLPLLDG